MRHRLRQSSCPLAKNMKIGLICGAVLPVGAAVAAVVMAVVLLRKLRDRLTVMALVKMLVILEEPDR